jgi:hypothetical protein
MFVGGFNQKTGKWTYLSEQIMFICDQIDIGRL